MFLAVAGLFIIESHVLLVCFPGFAFGTLDASGVAQGRAKGLLTGEN